MTGTQGPVRSDSKAGRLGQNRTSIWGAQHGRGRPWTEWFGARSAIGAARWGEPSERRGYENRMCRLRKRRFKAAMRSFAKSRGNSAILLGLRVRCVGTTRWPSNDAAFDPRRSSGSGPHRELPGTASSGTERQGAARSVAKKPLKRRALSSPRTPEVTEKRWLSRGSWPSR